jgi:SAM-dependent methyltransferase
LHREYAAENLGGINRWPVAFVLSGDALHYMRNVTTPGENASSPKLGFTDWLIGEGKAFAKAIIGRLAIKAFPLEASKLESNFNNYSGGLMQKVLKAGLFHKASSTGAFYLLAEYHRMYWQSPKAQEYYDQSERRFKEWLLGNHIVLTDILDALAGSCSSGFTSFYDIGCGSGFATRYMFERLPRLTDCVGIDLSATQIARNIQTSKNLGIRFEAGNANEWIRSHAKSNAIYFTSGGVLEYFTRDELVSLLKYVTTHLRPALFVSIEPVSPNHDMKRDISSRPLGPEMSFSHNYPSIFSHAGFKLESTDEQFANRIRWLLMLYSAL